MSSIDLTKQVKFSQAGCNAYLWQRLDGQLYFRMDDFISLPILKQIDQGANTILKTAKCDLLVPGGLTIRREIVKK